MSGKSQMLENLSRSLHPTDLNGSRAQISGEAFHNVTMCMSKPSIPPKDLSWVPLGTTSENRICASQNVRSVACLKSGTEFSAEHPAN